MSDGIYNITKNYPVFLRFTLNKVLFQFFREGVV
jgi:hypothetical protein